MLQIICAMSSKKPGLINVHQPSPRRTHHERESVQSFVRFFIKNINLYSYTRAKLYDNTAEYKSHTRTIVVRLKEADHQVHNDIVTGQCLEVGSILLFCLFAIFMQRICNLRTGTNSWKTGKQLKYYRKLVLERK